MSKVMDMVKPSELPRTSDGKMQKVIIAFDVDGTLITQPTDTIVPGVINNDSVPIVHQINTLKVLSTYKNVRIVVWSGGGKDYAEMWVKRLGIEKEVWAYASKTEYPTIRKMCDILIAVDDIQSTALGHANLIVREK